MKFLTCLLLVTLLVASCLPQNPEDFILLTLESIAVRQDSLLQKFDDLQTEISMMKDSQKTMEKNVGHLQTEISMMKDLQKTMEKNVGQLVNKLPLIEAQVDRCATQDQVDAFKTTFIAEQEIVKDVSQQCFTNQGMITFQNILERDECAELTHNCSRLATCSDSFLHYKCFCNPGYSGDGFTCQDINECIEESNMCGDNELCVNHPGNYSCTCLAGFQVEGNTCQDINECESAGHMCHMFATCHNTIGSYTCKCNAYSDDDGYTCNVTNCQSPAKVISDLGCVIPVATKISWDEAQETCHEKGGRLLEGLRREHLEPLRQHFVEYLKRPYAQIGLRGGLYVKSRLPVSSEDGLWRAGEPDGSDEANSDCGQVYLTASQSDIIDFDCTNQEPALCQLL